ncbi:MAG TPA: vWA domain-containing protein [Caulifigura sp.]|nr:vWA domain-containing protein [Caulifigura sp.]
MSHPSTITADELPPASSGVGASVAVSIVLHLALLGTFAAVGVFDAPAPVKDVSLDTVWQDAGDEAGPLTVLSQPVSALTPSPFEGLEDSVSTIVEAQTPALSIAPGGSREKGLPGRPISASDLMRRTGTGGSGITGTGAGEGNGVGDGKGFGFFGRRISGEKVVYVVDSSQSMAYPHPGVGKNRLGRVKLELINSIRGLTPNQKFFIVFFNDGPIPMPADRMVEANDANKLQFLRWTMTVPADGHTDPALALLLALRLNPDTIYFLTDGEFRPTIVREVAVSNRKGVKIHTIGFTQDRGETLLRTIAKQNGGTYTYVPPDEEPATVAEVPDPAMIAKP